MAFFDRTFLARIMRNLRPTSVFDFGCAIAKIGTTVVPTDFNGHFPEGQLTLTPRAIHKLGEKWHMMYDATLQIDGATIEYEQVYDTHEITINDIMQQYDFDDYNWHITDAGPVAETTAYVVLNCAKSTRCNLEGRQNITTLWISGHDVSELSDELREILADLVLKTSNKLAITPVPTVWLEKVPPAVAAQVREILGPLRYEHVTR